MPPKKNPPPEKPRCLWVSPGDALMREYHDKEWGVPVRNDRKLFEFLVLESFQAGLSWKTILYKRENFRKAFKDFDPKAVAAFGRKDIKRLLADAGIVRNRQKIQAAVNNAEKFLEVRKEFGSFSKYQWSFVGDKQITHRLRKLSDYPVTIPEAEEFASDLKKRGFKFLGPTTIYAHMQAAGMVNDHALGCFRYRQARPRGSTGRRP